MVLSIAAEWNLKVFHIGVQGMAHGQTETWPVAKMVVTSPTCPICPIWHHTCFTGYDEPNCFQSMDSKGHRLHLSYYCILRISGGPLWKGCEMSKAYWVPSCVTCASGVCKPRPALLPAVEQMRSCVLLPRPTSRTLALVLPLDVRPIGQVHIVAVERR